jgi:hypothetical protein
MNRKRNVVRPIQFDAVRREQRNRKALAARRRRNFSRKRLWWAMLRMLPGPDEAAWDREFAPPANDNGAQR